MNFSSTRTRKTNVGVRICAEKINKHYLLDLNLIIIFDKAGKGRKQMETYFHVFMFVHIIMVHSFICNFCFEKIETCFGLVKMFIVIVHRVEKGSPT